MTFICKLICPTLNFLPLTTPKRNDFFEASSGYIDQH